VPFFSPELAKAERKSWIWVVKSERIFSSRAEARRVCWDVMEVMVVERVESWERI
jgi:hypothetical protein